jgi:cytochrome c-type biogenesis protein CcmE
MKSRHKKLALIGGALAIIGIIAALVLNALNSNIALYITPTDVAAGKAPQARCSASAAGQGRQHQAPGRWRDHQPSSITDTEKDITVQLQGHPPRPLQGRQRRRRPGQADADGTFTATEVLAKHDENYMPPEAAKAVERRPDPRRQQADAPASSRKPVSELLSMIPELGHFALILAALVALVLGTLPLIGAHHNRMAWVAVARPAAVGAGAAGHLLLRLPDAGFRRQRFLGGLCRPALQFAAPHPVPRRRVWGGHEGSLLLWMLMLTWWAFAVAMLSRQLPEHGRPRPRHARPGRLRLPALHPDHLQPL